MKRANCPSFPVSIFVAGDYEAAIQICGTFCDEEGLCVTVTPTTYVYTDGEESGVIVGLINYPRFPSEGREIEATAKLLALELMSKLEQQSASIQTPVTTHWFSLRPTDVALALLDSISEPLNLPTQGIEARSDTTGTGVAEGESPVAKPCAQGEA